MLVLSQYVELGLAMKLLADSAEGVGYLLKDRISDVDEFVGAVRRVADGGSAIDPMIVSTLLSQRRSDDPLAELTPREREVLELMADGQLEPGDRRQAGDHAAGGREVRLEHLRASSGSPRPAASRGGCSPCCSTSAPETRTARRHQKPDPETASFPPSTRGGPACQSREPRLGREESRHEDAHNPGRAGRNR